MKMPMNLDLHTDSPERYVAQAHPMDLVTALGKLDAWDDTACAVADYLLNAWTLSACMRRDDREGLEDLEYCLHQVLDLTERPAPVAWQARWHGYLDLLQARALLHTDADDIVDLLGRKYVPEVLETLARASGEARQGKLRDALDIGQERLSQVLRQMEGRGLITRRRQGRENRVALTELGRTHTQPRQPSQGAVPGRAGMANPSAIDTYLLDLEAA